MVGESSEEEIEVVEVVVEAVEEASSQLDPSTLGVPGLKTLVPGDRVEVLWSHGMHTNSRPHPRTQQCASETPRAARRLGEGASQGVRARDACAR